MGASPSRSPSLTRCDWSCRTQSRSFPPERIEYGPHGSRNPPGDCDYRRFLAGLEQHFPKTCFFMSWNAKWSLATNQYTQKLLDHPSVINREDLPARLFQPE